MNVDPSLLETAISSNDETKEMSPSPIITSREPYSALDPVVPMETSQNDPVDLHPVFSM